jgi:hypothetical protein
VGRTRHQRRHGVTRHGWQAKAQSRWRSLKRVKMPKSNLHRACRQERAKCLYNSISYTLAAVKGKSGPALRGFKVPGLRFQVSGFRQGRAAAWGVRASAETGRGGTGRLGAGLKMVDMGVGGQINWQPSSLDWHHRNCVACLALLELKVRLSCLDCGRRPQGLPL